MTNKFGGLFLQMQNFIEHDKFKPYEYEKASIHMSNLISHQRIHIGKESFSCKKCAKTFSYKSHNESENNFSQKEYFTKHYTAHSREKSYKCKEGAKSSSQKIIPLPIRRCILERNHLDVMTVKKFLFRSHASLNIRRCIMEKNPIHVKNVGKPSAVNQIT